ncbi:MAG: PilN domain-containing protein [Syntrophobacteraceae bacterium]
MLKGIIRYRPKSLCAVYVESRRIEVLRASRKWRSWQMEPAEQHLVPEGDSVLDYLQFLNIRPRARKGSALLLFVPGTYYSVHREHYPPSLAEQLEEAINFDWQENIFHEHDRTLHFFGPSLPINHHISVPIFAIQREVYDKFHQALNAQLFQIFTVMPSAPAFNAFLSSPVPGEPAEPLEILGRVLDNSQLEVHRFYRGAFLDSTLIGKSQHSLRIFSENLRCLGSANGDTPAETAPRIHLLCTEQESPGATASYGAEWVQEGLPISLRKIREPFVTNWVRRLLQQDKVHTFDTEILLKPWRVPRAAWPLLGIVLLFVMYAFYQLSASDSLMQTNKRLRRQVNQLETQWKPIEELQTRISKFQEDRKTLSEFSREGYPLIELLGLLTIVTPDDTWLNYLSLRKGQIVIRGESKSAIKYLSELSKTEGLSDVKFASPVTRNPTSDMERFNVQLQLDMEKLRKTLEAIPAEKFEGPPPDATPAPAVQTVPEVRRGRPPAPEPDDVGAIEEETYFEETPPESEEVTQ